MPISILDVLAMREKTSTVINDRLEKIKALELENEADAETLMALDVLEKKLRSMPPEQKSIPEFLAKPSDTNSQTNFAQTVRSAVQKIGDDVFTIQNVENVLKAQNIALPERNARIRIAMEVKRMVAKGQVAIAERGKGTAAFKYRYIREPNVSRGKPIFTAATTVGSSY